MVNYYVERLGQAVVTIFTVISLSFVLIRLMPGGPMDYLRAQLSQTTSSTSTMSEEEAAALIETYLNVNPQQPLWEAYIDYMFSIFQGDFGQSIWYEEEVSSILSEAITWTVFVMSISTFLTFGFGVTLGAVLAYREGSWSDLTISTGSIILSSTPFYILALILLSIFTYRLGWFPTGGKFNPDTTAGLNLPFIIGILKHATLPIISLVLTEFGGWALTMRGNSISVLGEDYLRVAHLRGLSDWRITSRYVGRNAILPMYTGLMISIGFLFGGAIILEEIFKYQGVGYYMLRALNARDWPLLMGGFIIITVAVVIGIFIADLTYGKIDPRASSGGGEREAY